MFLNEIIVSKFYYISFFSIDHTIIDLSVLDEEARYFLLSEIFKQLILL